MKCSKSKGLLIGAAFFCTALVGFHPTAKADNQSQFISTYATSAQTLANQMNLYPSVMIAQMALESRYGTSGLTQSANNLFGVKGKYNGQSIALKTQEQEGKKLITITDHFRAYPSYWASMVDYSMIMQQRHFSGAWVSNTTSYKQATKALQGVYATDANYNKKLNTIIQQYNLTRYDRQSVVKKISSVANGYPAKKQATYHRVQTGETLSYIALKYGVSERKIAAQNNLSDTNHLLIGKRLTIY